MVHHRRAVTLVETLVVLVVMSTLIVLVLPGLAGARRRSRDAVCLSNLRQIAAGICVYRADHQGALPASWDEIDLDPRLLRCPSDAEQRPIGYLLIDPSEALGSPHLNWSAVIDVRPPASVALAADWYATRTHANVCYLDGHAARR